MPTRAHQDQARSDAQPMDRSTLPARGDSLKHLEERKAKSRAGPSGHKTTAAQDDGDLGNQHLEDVPLDDVDSEDDAKETPLREDTTAEQPNDLSDCADRPRSPGPKSPGNGSSTTSPSAARAGVSEWSHQQLAVQPEEDDGPKKSLDDEWQVMPAFAPFDIYDDNGKLIAKESAEESVDPDVVLPAYHGLGSAAKGYTRVQVDDDAQSATSMEENTAYLFKEPVNTLQDDDEDGRDIATQIEMTKTLLTDNQRIAYIGIVKLAAADMEKTLNDMERTRGAKKEINFAIEASKRWAQKMMVRLYAHMDLEAAEQIMIEQLAEHGLQASDLTPALMTSSHVKNPMGPTSNEHRSGTPETPEVSKADTEVSKTSSAAPKMESEVPETDSKVPKTQSVVSKTEGPTPNGDANSPSFTSPSQADKATDTEVPAPSAKGEEDLPPYQEVEADSQVPQVQDASNLFDKKELDIDLRWTVLCDLFLILIADSMYDARSRVLFEKVAAHLDVSWIDVCRFEKRITEALEMEEEAQKEDWNEAEHMEERRKRARNRRLALMGLATVGGGLIIGLSAGLLAPLIGAGIASGLTAIGVSGTTTVLAGTGGAAVIGTAGTLTGGTIGVRAANRRTGAVKTFEYRPLHNNKRVNLIVTVAGWMTGKVDDVRLPFSTINPAMGDIYSILWEPEMLRSMGDTINILATEALTQGLQQILGSTILIALMAALQAPILLTKLSYLIDNPWSNSVARADMAGLILADSLIDRNLGARPITLIGFSLGSRVIFSALKELASKGAVGLVQNVYLYGTPVVANKDQYLKARSVVSGRFVNGYSTNDWILGYLFRATSGGVMRVAGLAEVKIPTIENVNVTEWVPGHMSYRTSMPRLLREAGWMIESDEFTEIEDPDPDNHEQRQRELINEIEEARKELEAKPEKRRFGIFRRKKLAQKKEWEVYDERMLRGNPASSTQREGDADGPLFDIEAIRKEAIELAAEGIQIKELQSTMPPMKIDPSALAATPPARSSDNISRPDPNRLPSTEVLPIRTNGGDLESRAKGKAKESSDRLNGFTSDPRHSNADDESADAEDEVRMSFEPSRGYAFAEESPRFEPPSFRADSRSPSPPFRDQWQTEERGWGRDSRPTSLHARNGSGVTMPQPFRSSRTPSPAKSAPLPVGGFDNNMNSSGYFSAHDERTTPAVAADRNVWADDDDQGKDEVSMTFE